MNRSARTKRPTRLLLVTLGSRGDVEPFVHLARAAQRAGLVVRLAVPDQREVDTRGLDAVGLGIRFSDLAPTPGSSAMSEFRKVRPAIGRALQNFVEVGLDWAPDIIVSHPKVLTAPVVAARRDIPYLTAELTPTLTPTAQFPAAGIASRSLGRVLNRASYRAVGMAGAMFAADVRAARRRVGIPGSQKTAPSATLVAVSPSLLPRPADWPTTAHITGNWHGGSGRDVEDPSTADFIRDEAPFVYAGLGSMVGGDASTRAEAIIEGARRAGLRVLMSTGWGGLQPPVRCLGPDVFVTASVPHEAVLPHAIAAIHHGGAGTTHAVTRAGIPSIVVPFLADQPFWARRLHALGLAPAPLHRNRLSSDRVRAALAASLDCAARARDTAARMNVEDGVGEAVARITAAAPTDRSAS